MRSYVGGREARIAERQFRLYVERLRNPIWWLNRLGFWGRRRDWLFWELMIAICILVPAAMAVSHEILARMAGLTLVLITAMQCCAAYAMIRWFEFVGCRRWLLEELSMTEVSFDELAYGSFEPPFRYSMWLFLALLVAGDVFLFDVNAWWGTLALGLVAPVQWLLFCTTSAAAIRNCSLLRPWYCGYLWGNVFAIILVSMAGAVVAVVGECVRSVFYSLGAGGGVGPEALVVLFGGIGIWWIAVRTGLKHVEEARDDAALSYEYALCEDGKGT